LNVTVPVGVPDVPLTGEIVAVNVTFVPAVTVPAEAVSAAVVPAGVVTATPY
jgi:hypothetical protein